MKFKNNWYIGALIGAIAYFVALGWAGATDRARSYTAQLNATCGQFHSRECDALIWQVNAAGYEVIYAWDQYIAEPKDK